MERLSKALIVGVLGFVIHASSASAQFTIAINEPLTVVPGQTQVRFTPSFQAYSRTFSCFPNPNTNMNYLQKVIMQNQGSPGDTKSTHAFTDAVGPEGRFYTVCGISFSCEGYQFLQLEVSCPP
jgi:hypothetical protein